MDNNPKTKEELIKELEELRQENISLRASHQKDFAKSWLDESNLQINEAQKNAILNGISSNIAFVDKDLKIIWANKTAADSVNKTPEEMNGQTCHHFWADPAKPCENCPSLKALETQKTENTIIQTTDGRIWEERGEPVFDANGNLLGIVEIATDITEQKIAEQELRISEERYRLLAENSQDVIWTMKLDGSITYISPAVEKLRGFTVEEAMHQPIEKILTPNSQVIVLGYLQTLNSAFKSGLPLESFKGENEYYCKDGTTLWTDVFVYPLPATDNSSVTLLGVTRDISARKRADSALRDSEDKFRSLYANMIDGAALHTIVYDNSGTPEDYIIVDVNPAFEALLGISRDSVLNKTSMEAYKVEQPPYLEIYARVVSTGTPEVFETYFAPLEMYFSISVYCPFKGSFATIFKNITERKKAEQELQVILSKYKVLFDIFPIGITVSDTSGKIIESNKIADTILGISHEEQEKRKIDGEEWRIIRPDGSTMAVSDYASVRALEEGRTVNNVELGIVKSDNQVTWLNVSATPIPIEGYGVAIVYGDITERKKAEEVLRKSEIMLSETGRLAKLGGWEIDLATSKLTWTKETYHIHEVATEIDPNLEDGIRFYAPEAQPILNKAIDRAINHGEPFDLELPFITAKGNHLWVRSIGNVEKTNGLTTRLYGVFQDITERKQLEATFSVIVEKNPMSIQILDMDGYTVQTNSAHTKLFGVAPPTHYSIFEDTQLMQQGFGVLFEKMKNGEVVYFPDSHFNVHNVDHSFPDSPVWIKAVGFTLNGKEGKPDRIILMHENITERKKAEEELHNANSYLENLINYANAPIIVWDPQFRITRFNHAFENLTGRKESEVLGKTIEILFAAEAKDNSMELIRKTQSGERWETVEIEIQHIDGSSRTVLWNSATLFSPDDKTPIATIAQGQEITRRKMAEEELKQFSTRLTLATRAGGVGVWDLDLKNNALLWDDQMFLLYGVSKENFSGAFNAWQAVVHPEDKAQAEEEIQKAIESKKEFNTEFRVIWPDGSIHSIRALAFVQRDESGKPLRMIGTNWDITNQKKSEFEIKTKNKELEKLNSEKDKFFSIIAHDLRGPFNGFLGLTQIMAEQFKSLTLTQLQEISVSLNKSAKNLFNLLNNLLEWSRMQQGTISFEPTSIPLYSFATYALNPVMEPAGKKGVALSIDIPENMHVYADENMLASTIRNLASNAIKYTPSGGKVIITAKPSDVNKIEISVKDTGIGMDAEILGNMFKLDVSISRKGTDGEPSTGLGLLLCKDFIEKHGGRIWAESEEGKGSTFYFTLPVDKNRV